MLAEPLKTYQLRCFAVDDLLDLAAVEAEVSDYRALAVACGVQLSYRLLQRRGRVLRSWFVLLHLCLILARGRFLGRLLGVVGVGAGLVVLADKHHDSKEPTSARAGHVLTSAPTNRRTATAPGTGGCHASIRLALLHAASRYDRC